MIPKSYVYKVYRSGAFLGVLDSVVSEFGYSQDINTAGSSLSITVAKNVDVAPLSVSNILDETGAAVLDETSSPLVEERAADVVGDSSEDILIRNGNVVEVYEVSASYPNGLNVFTGKIVEWEADIASENTKAGVTITVYSNGMQLDNYIIQDAA